MKYLTRDLHQVYIPQFDVSVRQQTIHPTAAPSTRRNDRRWVSVAMVCSKGPIAIRKTGGDLHHVLPPSVRMERAQCDLLRLWSRAEHRSIRREA